MQLADRVYFFEMVRPTAGLLEHALVRDGTSQLQLVALQALLEVAGAEPAAFAQHYAPRLHWLRGFLGHNDSAGPIYLRAILSISRI